jgi:hypothetical protein
MELIKALLLNRLADAAEPFGLVIVNIPRLDSGLGWRSADYSGTLLTAAPGILHVVLF